jgi:hypothetical protein
MYVIEENLADGRISTRALRFRYYAIGISRLLSLMEEAGFTKTVRIDDVFWQPILVGTRPA